MDIERVIEIGMWLMAVLLCLTIHEFAHAKYADWAGDPTPRSQGRVTLNPIAHLDPLGTILILIMTISGYGIGWGKPVQVNPGYFRHPRRDWVMCAFWGPLSNILFAILCALVVRLMIFAGIAESAGVFFDFFVMLVLVNVGLALFNMIPIHPLDGSKVLSGFFEDVFDRRYWSWQMTYGPIILMVAVGIVPIVTDGAVRPIGLLLGPLYEFVYRLLLF